MHIKMIPAPSKEILLRITLTMKTKTKSTFKKVHRNCLASLVPCFQFYFHKVTPQLKFFCIYVQKLHCILNYDFYGSPRVKPWRRLGISSYINYSWQTSITKLEHVPLNFT